MQSKAKLVSGLVAAAVIVLTAVGAVSVLLPGEAPASLPPAVAAIPLEVLTRPIVDGESGAEQLRRGQYLLRAGDCMVCHTGPGRAPLAGGLGLRTPFGVIYSTNLTPDGESGIGSMTSDQFYGALHDGQGGHGAIYPAMPYPYFTKVTRSDSDAMFAYLKSVPAAAGRTPANDLHFPFDIRALVNVWNALFFTSRTYQSDPGRSAEWNRGAYLVEGLGHCGACHTPKNAMAGDRRGSEFQGGALDNWLAPDLTGNERTGLGRWSVDEIAEYLRTGRNVHASAGGAMADVVTYSTSLLEAGDLRAIALYLKSQDPSADVAAARPDRGAMSRGEAIYSDACASCHLEAGVGQPRYFPPLVMNAVVQQADPTSVVHLILSGTRVAVTPARPSPLAMPSFAWKLSDAEIADVATYIRNSWGNQAAPVSTEAVGAMRRRLDLKVDHLTANSGDQP
jgi:mono/diheme cytochrome c family protein